MTPAFRRTNTPSSSPWTALTWAVLAGVVGAGGMPVVFAQQGVSRRPATSAAPSTPARKGVAASPKQTVAATGQRSSASRAKPQRAQRASSSGVKQTSAVVSADGGVVLAGGAAATADCRDCGRQGCGKCRAVGGRLGHVCNGLCDQGGCPAHCPVRPDQFGYYATRWRSWPGQGVKQTGAFDPASTPVLPPRSEVPGMAEELSLPSQEAEESVDDEAEDDEQAEGGGAAMDDASAPSGGAQGDAAEPEAGKQPAAEPSAPDRNPDGSDGDKDVTDAAIRPADALEPIDSPLDTSDAAATPATRQTQAEAWSRLSVGTASETRSPADAESVVRISAPVGGSADVPREQTRQAGMKYRSPGQRMVEEDEGTAGRWRAKAAAAGGTGGSAPANPLRGVTAQPGNPLR